MRNTTYLDCPYSEDNPKLLEKKQWHEYPCYHPRNANRTCPFRNKAPKQKDLCPLPE